MEWMKAIEDAVNYIETHITEEIDAEAVAKHVCITPSAARREGVMLKSFAPLKLTISLKGGYLMDYKITKKESFTVLGSSRIQNRQSRQKAVYHHRAAVRCIMPAT